MNNLLVETLTPIHIGNGRILQHNSDYFYFPESRQVCFVDDRKVVGIIGEENIETWISLVSKNESVLDYLKKRQVSLQPNDIGKRVINLKTKSNPSAGNSGIREQLSTGNKQPLLPGSSLKGAVRTAIFNSQIKQNPNAALDVSTYREIRKGKVQFKGDRLEKSYLGKDPNHSVFRFLRIGDIHFEKTECWLTETLNELHGGLEMKNRVQQHVECIAPFQTALGRVHIPKDQINQIKKHSQHNHSDFPLKTIDSITQDLDQLFQLINQHSFELITKEIELYSKFNLPSGGEDYLDQLVSIQEKIKSVQPNECILRVGFGSGYLGMTGGWPIQLWQKLPNNRRLMEELGTAVRRNDRYNHMRLPKSRKLTNQGIPLGYVRLTHLNEEQMLAWEQKSIHLQKEKLKLEEFKRSQEKERALALQKELEEQLERERLALEQAKLPQWYEGPISKNLHVDAEVIYSQKPNKVKLFIKGFESRLFDMTESAPQPVGFVCRVELVVENGKILRSRYLGPK